MKDASVEGWNVVDRDAAVLWREYKFSKSGSATTMVFRGNRGLIVVSPGSRMDPRALDALAEFGNVEALIANNAFHHLGHSEWRARFPEAKSYAPAAALPRLAKKASGVSFEPLSNLQLPRSVHYQDAPGFKTGDVILSVDSAKGAVWYTSDLLTNIPSLPPWPVRWLFTATDSAPGFRLFRLGVWLLVKDKRALRDWTLGEMDKHVPSVVIPGHGAAVDTADVADRMREQLHKL